MPDANPHDWPSDLRRRLMAQLLTGFALLGFFLATLGIYGAMARMVAQRTDEIGVRMAVGAQVRDVLRLVLGSGIRIAATGLAVGVPGSFALSRLLGSVLPGMEPGSGLVGAAALAALPGAAGLACCLPARRAARIDPLVALRSE